MQRNMDLARQLLLAVEASPESSISDLPSIPGWSSAEIAYHLQLLDQARLLKTSSRSVLGGGVYFTHIALTWEGHDFLDAARDENVWQKTTSTISEKVRSASFEVLKELLVVTARSMLGM